jgi:hypothetical protein
VFPATGCQSHVTISQPPRHPVRPGKLHPATDVDLAGDGVADIIQRRQGTATLLRQWELNHRRVKRDACR